MSLTRKDKILCAVYLLIAVVALVATWMHNLAFFAQPDNGGLAGFIRALYVNHATASITNDILLFGLAAGIFMIQEAKRLAIRHVWLYLVFALVIAVSVTFPLFLAARQVAIAKARPAQA